VQGAMGKDALIQPWNKGLGAMSRALEPAEIAARGWRLLEEDLSLPAAVLYESKLQHNLAWMQSFAAEYGARLAPHGKTTMAPKLFARQIGAGAWGITLATAQQTRAAYTHGVRRVLMANQLVGRQNMEMIAELIRDPGFEFYCLVDSAAQVEQLGRFFSAKGQRLNVLLEAGVEGGRTGVRNAEQRDALLGALESWRGTLLLCGVEFFEGVLDSEAGVRAFLTWAVELARFAAQAKRFDRDPVILTGAGSAWYDVVAEVFAEADLGCAKEIILRPGCYLTHDAGVYRTAQERILATNPIARRMHSGLEPALQLWAYVQSVPEERKAVIGLGKRDAAFDTGLPLPVLHYRPGAATPSQTPAHWKLTRMMDQHAFLEIDPGDEVQPGDMIGFDISHPCLTFDKWRYIPVVDDTYRVIDIVETFF
jgi:D-serine dehydratase